MASWVSRTNQRECLQVNHIEHKFPAGTNTIVKNANIKWTSSGSNSSQLWAIRIWRELTPSLLPFLSIFSKFTLLIIILLRPTNVRAWNFFPLNRNLTIFSLYQVPGYLENAYIYSIHYIFVAQTQIENLPKCSQCTWQAGVHWWSLGFADKPAQPTWGVPGPWESLSSPHPPKQWTVFGHILLSSLSMHACTYSHATSHTCTQKFYFLRKINFWDKS